MMKVGQKVICRPVSMGGGQLSRDLKEQHPLRTGRIFYVHPLGRYVTVEFELAGGRVRESFKPLDVQLCGHGERKGE